MADTDTDHFYKNEYVYEDDILKQVKHNTTGNTSDVVYHFTYDALGANTNVSVGNQTIITKAYSEDRSHVLESETYGNGGSITYGYDDFDRLTEVKLDNDNTKKVTYTYGNNGQIEKVENAETGITRTFRYDLAGRPMGSEEKNANGTTVHSLRATYDECQNLESSIEKVQTGANTLTAYKTRYVYDRDDRIAATLFGEDADTTRTTLIYDSLGRIKTRKTYIGSCNSEESYTFAAGYTGYSANATTDLVTGMSQTGMAQSYAYDVNGRITSWTCNNKVCSYEYDSIGQLIRVNDEKDPRGGTDGTTWTYKYDNGGNITYRRKYAYTEGTLPDEPLETTAYSYGADWKDKLTGYTVTDSNNNTTETTISSDSIGNITGDGTWSYTWQAGRRLAGMTKIGTSISYLYDENGQRIKKSVTENGVTTDTFYTVAGKSVTHVIRGTEDLHISYASGQPSPLQVRKQYVYLCLQPAWRRAGAEGQQREPGCNVPVRRLRNCHLNRRQFGKYAGSDINPFRYRGYVYDTETRLYYLRGRYYDPEKCRFISSDSILGQTGRLLQHNLFCYCENDSIQYYDLNGHIPEWAKALKDEDNKLFNCCGYAVDKIEWMLPGGNERLNEYKHPTDPTRVHQDYFDVHLLAGALISDLGGEEYAKIVKSIKENVPEGWHMIALRTYCEADNDGYVYWGNDSLGLSSHGDFHFLRLDGKVWSHKLSKDAAEDLIEDRYPDAEDLWFRGSIKKYNSDIVYMVVKDIW